MVKRGVIVSLVFIASLLFLIFGAGASAFSGSGTGTLADPYVITTCVQLQEMKDFLGANYSLGGNVNCSDTKNWDSGKGFLPIGNATNNFFGSLNGDNYNISELFINRAVDNVGLFSGVSNSVIKNLNLVDVIIAGSQNVGGLAGSSGNSIIQSVHVSSGVVSGGGLVTVGGLVGALNGGSITNSSSGADVFGRYYVGGLVGIIDGANATIESCYTNGKVFGGVDVIGGLVGYALRSGTLIKNSYSSGFVRGSDDVGGLVGLMGGVIINSYSNSTIIGWQYPSDSSTGGLVGAYIGKGINNSFYIGNVSTRWTSSQIGGLAGINEGGINVVNSYYNNNSLIPRVCIGTGSSAGCTAIQNDEEYFKNSLNQPMASWDFAKVWKEVSGRFPVLAWQNVVADADGDGVSDSIDNCNLNNPLQGDYDSDGIGDLCDVCPALNGTTCSLSSDNIAVEINSSGGSVISAGANISLNIPSGALPNSSTIIIQSHGLNAFYGGLAVSESGWGVTVGYTILPHVTFSSPVQLCFTTSTYGISDDCTGFFNDTNFIIAKDVNPGACGPYNASESMCLLNENCTWNPIDSTCNDWIYETTYNSTCTDLAFKLVKVCANVTSFSRWGLFFTKDGIKSLGEDSLKNGESYLINNKIIFSYNQSKLIAGNGFELFDGSCFESMKTNEFENEISFGSSSACVRNNLSGILAEIQQIRINSGGEMLFSILENEGFSCFNGKKDCSTDNADSNKKDEKKKIKEEIKSTKDEIKEQREEIKDLQKDKKKTSKINKEKIKEEIGKIREVITSLRDKIRDLKDNLKK